MVKPQLNSTHITFLTLASALVGLVTISFSYSLALLLVPILLAPKYIYAPSVHSWTMVAQFTLTTFVFGIINAFSLIDIFAFLTIDTVQAVPTMQIYLSMLIIYHYFEFQLINNFHHPILNWYSFLIYHSQAYMIATFAMAFEHVLLKFILKLQYKVAINLMQDDHPLIVPGLILAILGQGLRIAAFFTCKSNFTHIVSFRKRKTHQLITNGVYSFFRHPSYTGYFYFAIGGQLMLGNFISTVLFFIALSKFFNSRIQFQQKALAAFFPEYPSYAKSTYILIPFVSTPNLLNYEPQYDYGQND